MFVLIRNRFQLSASIALLRPYGLLGSFSTKRYSQKCRREAIAAIDRGQALPRAVPAHRGQHPHTGGRQADAAGRLQAESTPITPPTVKGSPETVTGQKRMVDS